jgi:diguanylate cyclase (GGDEF)-like protein
MFILGIVSAFGIIEMIRIIDLHHYEKNIYFSGLLLVGFFTYASFRIRFLWSVALGIITITAYELMVILVNDVDMKYIVASSFFLIPFHVAGIIFSYTLELDSRNYFILMKELMKEKTTLTDLNLKLDKLAHIDGLTKIANKRYLMEKLKYFWFEHKKLKLPLSVIMIDVDFFKNYNDLYGHLEGDKVLQAIAETLQNVIRKDADIVGRFGGEEFLVILTETPSDKAFDVAERIRLKIENLKIPHENSEVSPYVTVSLGVASVIPEDDDFEKIIELADIALYRAKNSGRNKVVENF